MMYPMGINFAHQDTPNWSDSIALVCSRLPLLQLKFAKDLGRWLYWLFEAKKHYGLRIVNYIVTSNLIHLLILDNPGEEEYS